MTARGSYSDYLTLADRLDEYDRSERIAALLDCQWASKLADEAYIRLTQQAIACGLPWSTEMTVSEWSRHRTASFQNMRRAA